MERLTFLAISLLFLDRFRRFFLRFCHLGFDEEAISDVLIFFNFFWVGYILSDYRELIFYGPQSSSPLQGLEKRPI